MNQRFWGRGIAQLTPPGSAGSVVAVGADGTVRLVYIHHAATVYILYYLVCKTLCKLFSRIIIQVAHAHWLNCGLRTLISDHCSTSHISALHTYSGDCRSWNVWGLCC